MPRHSLGTSPLRKRTNCSNLTKVRLLTLRKMNPLVRCTFVSPTVDAKKHAQLLFKAGCCDCVSHHTQTGFSNRFSIVLASGRCGSMSTTRCWCAEGSPIVMREFTPLASTLMKIMHSTGRQGGGKDIRRADGGSRQGARPI
jgi:hypothetical protein